MDKKTWKGEKISRIIGKYQQIKGHSQQCEIRAQCYDNPMTNVWICNKSKTKYNLSPVYIRIILEFVLEYSK